MDSADGTPVPGAGVAPDPIGAAERLLARLPGTEPAGQVAVFTELHRHLVAALALSDESPGPARPGGPVPGRGR
jgi:hypothetical protein